ncbi:hypothetical protein TIFTF001_035823 [Ficus carica]|uniref:Uncharacterized protein n=1 Tax=Ficus carica TaxID=3494 RepID=A0AA88E317_FICCA|nr:hypothetical protein TIFTF001_035796 [Ficus carica]GMN66738.1 hypothetical protein TIFTF001_035807 [Ficus carica]GMN66751.1 hypothetical protein TIFTF001_035812 [Ficus carica]GMN66754.1 hypothetical protein TIFTF001_035823 [Ficus carica]
MMPAYGVIFSLILLPFLATVISTSSEASLVHVNGSVEEPPLLPLVEEGKMEMVMMNESRRKLGSFQICALCTCCGGAKVGDIYFAMGRMIIMLWTTVSD